MEFLVVSLSSCHMLWYLHLCSEAGVIVMEDADNATGKMVETANGGGHFTEVVLNPKVRVAESSMIEKANELHKKANDSRRYSASESSNCRCSARTPRISGTRGDQSIFFRLPNLMIFSNISSGNSYRRAKWRTRGIISFLFFSLPLRLKQRASQKKLNGAHSYSKLELFAEFGVLKLTGKAGKAGEKFKFEIINNLLVNNGRKNTMQ